MSKYVEYLCHRLEKTIKKLNTKLQAFQLLDTKGILKREQNTIHRRWITAAIQCKVFTGLGIQEKIRFLTDDFHPMSVNLAALS